MFLLGLDLSCAFFQECVQPIVARTAPQLRYTAALIGPGSEVIGCDDRRSTDHHYGPRVLLFLAPEQLAAREKLDQALRQQLPVSFRGYSTHFGDPGPNDNGTRLMRPIRHGPINHMVPLLTLRGWFSDYLGWDYRPESLTPAAWLTFPQQKVLTVTAGGVFHDDLNLAALRRQFAWYPHDVWLYLMAAGWTRIGQEEHLTGRTGEVGDELGSSLLGSRLVQDVIRLCFLMFRRYAPYPKWLGTHFQRLPIGPTLAPLLRQVQLASTWQDRERSLCRAFEILADQHNQLGLTQPMPARVSGFFGRPFQVIHGGRFADALLGQIQDATVQGIAKRTRMGGVDQISDSTDLLEAASLRTTLEMLYQTSTS